MSGLRYFLLYAFLGVGDMKVRQARKRKDIDKLCALETDAFSEADAATRESMERRLNTHPNTFWVIDKDKRIVSGINGILTNEKDLCDEMYADEKYYDEDGKWLMLFGVATLTEYRHKGYASAIMRQVMQDAKVAGIEGIVLTCKDGYVGYYEQFGFVDEGPSKSTHGGASWHQMRLLCKDIKRNYKAEIIDLLVTVAIAAVLAFIVGNFILLNCNVPTGSMLETIQLGDNIIGNRLAYKVSDPERGDIAIFKFPDDESQVYIKRIIGLPGETIDIIDGKIYVNESEVPLKEDYLNKNGEPDRRTFGRYEVPEDCYLMLGDNRYGSADARLWNNTYVKREKILAKAEFIYFPFSHAAWLGDGADYGDSDK